MMTTKLKREWLEANGTITEEDMCTRWEPTNHWLTDEVYATSCTDDMDEAVNTLYDYFRESLWDAIRDAL